MVAPTFESARVCVQRRTPRPAEVPEWAEQAMRNPASPPANTVEMKPGYSFEVVAWPPGTVDGGLLPTIGDVLTLPGYDTPFRIVDRALHWPAPTSPEARRGEIRVDLIVEEEQAAWAASRPGRPGEDQIRAEGRWLQARVQSFEARTSFGGTPYTRVDFAIPGVGTLSRQIMRNWQALELFPGWAGFQNRPSHEIVHQGELQKCLQFGQEFEVRVAPSDLPSQNGRLEIWEVRPPQKLEPGEEPNTWAENANEVTAEAWGEI